MQNTMVHHRRDPAHPSNKTENRTDTLRSNVDMVCGWGRPKIVLCSGTITGSPFPLGLGNKEEPACQQVLQVAKAHAGQMTLKDDSRTEIQAVGTPSRRKPWHPPFRVQLLEINDLTN